MSGSDAQAQNLPCSFRGYLASSRHPPNNPYSLIDPVAKMDPKLRLILTERASAADILDVERWSKGRYHTE